MKILKITLVSTMLLLTAACMNTTNTPPITETPAEQTSAPTTTSDQRFLVFFPGDMCSQKIDGTPANRRLVNEYTGCREFGGLIANFANPSFAGTKWDGVMVSPTTRNLNTGSSRHTTTEFNGMCERAKKQLQMAGAQPGAQIDFFGWSMGAAAAIHCAHRILSEGQYHLGYVAASDGGCSSYSDAFANGGRVPSAAIAAGDPVRNGMATQVRARSKGFFVYQAERPRRYRFENGETIHDNHDLTSCFPQMGIPITQRLPGSHAAGLGPGARLFKAMAH